MKFIMSSLALIVAAISQSNAQSIAQNNIPFTMRSNVDLFTGRELGLCRPDTKQCGQPLTFGRFERVRMRMPATSQRSGPLNLNGQFEPTRKGIKTGRYMRTANGFAELSCPTNVLSNEQLRWYAEKIPGDFVPVRFRIRNGAAPNRCIVLSNERTLGINTCDGSESIFERTW